MLAVCKLETADAMQMVLLTTSFVSVDHVYCSEDQMYISHEEAGLGG